jgi:outer membrane immunogenic protein
MQRTGLLGAIGALIATAVLTIAFVAVPLTVTFADGIANKSRIKGEDAAIAVVPSWTGTWIGGNLGYAVQTSKVAGEDGGWISTPFSFDSAADGITYGVSAGYNLQLQSFVVGVFADYDWTNAKNQFSIPTSPETLVGDVGIHSMWTLGVRAGYLITPRVLLYGLGGYTKINWSVPTNADTGNVGDPGGLTVGLGAEAMASSGWSIKLEYRFIDLGGDTLTYDVSGPTDAKVVADHNLHAVRLGLAYKFNFGQ